MNFSWELVDAAGKIVKNGLAENLSYAIGAVLNCIHERNTSMVILNRSPKFITGFSSDGKLFWKVEV